jgi:hypothetical protein
VAKAPSITMSDKTRLRIVASTDPADLPPEPTDLRGQFRRMMELAFRYAAMKVRSVDGDKP